MLHSIIISSADKKSREEAIKKIFRKKGKNQKVKENPDTLIIDQEKAIGIESIRKIKNWLSKKAYQEKKRFILIYQAQNLTPEAQNAFLKTLEEPPLNTIIILITDNSYQLLPTIISRCQVIRPKKTTVDCSLQDKQFAEILNKNIGKKIIFAHNRGGERQKFLSWINEQKQYYRQSLTPEATKILLTLEQIETMTKANVSPRLALIYSLL